LALTLLSMFNMYSDIEFKAYDTLDNLIEKENLVMLKNCVTVCEKWYMSLDDIALFLNKVTGFDLNPQVLLNSGQEVVNKVWNLCKLLDSEHVTYDPENIYSQYLPLPIKKNIQAYSEKRGLN